MGTWFAVFPTVETLIGQALALLFVVGPFMWVRAKVRRRVIAEPSCPVQAEAMECAIHPNHPSAACPICEHRRL